MITTKKNKILYWTFTIWLSLGMISTGIAQLIKIKDEVTNFNNLGYPNYLLSLLGIWKVLGVVAILIPKFPLLKEWAYAGFFFVMSGAIISHLIMNDPPIAFFGPTLLVILTLLSWYFRPAKRKFYTLKY